jgi:hypothetical protein
MGSAPDGGWTVEGLDALQRLLRRGSQDTVKALGRALTEEAQLVMRASQQQVPVKDGFLKASGEIKEPKFSSGFVKVTMGYGGAASDYALIVHNGPEKNWTKSGTKSHFLSDPLQAAVPRIGDAIARRIGKLLA